MPPRQYKIVVNVTFQGDEWDYDERVTLGTHAHYQLKYDHGS